MVPSEWPMWINWSWLVASRMNYAAEIASEIAREIESVDRSTRHHSRVRRTLIMAGISYEAISSLERCESATVECCEGIVTARRRQPDSANNIPRELPERLLFERNHRGQ